VQFRTSPWGLEKTNIESKEGGQARPLYREGGGKQDLGVRVFMEKKTLRKKRRKGGKGVISEIGTDKRAQKVGKEGKGRDSCPPKEPNGKKGGRESDPLGDESRGGETFGGRVFG